MSALRFCGECSNMLYPREDKETRAPSTLANPASTSFAAPQMVGNLTNITSNLGLDLKRSFRVEMAFYKPECRYDYAMQELYKERQRRAGALALKRVRRAKAKGKASEVDDDKGEGLMFFTCAKIL